MNILNNSDLIGTWHYESILTSRYRNQFFAISTPVCGVIIQTQSTENYLGSKISNSRPDLRKSCQIWHIRNNTTSPVVLVMSAKFESCLTINLVPAFFGKQFARSFSQNAYVTLSCCYANNPQHLESRQYVRM